MKKYFSFPLGVLAIALVFSSLGTSAFASNFSDTGESQFQNSIEWMSRNGVVNGYADGTFKPMACVNRVEFLKMLFKTRGVDENVYSSELFSDTPADAWFTPYVMTARARGVVNGYSDGTFRPGQCVTKAEATKMALLMYYSQDEISDGAMDSYVTWLSDLNDSQWYYSFAAFSYNRNFWPKSSDSSLGANSGMTREEVAELLYRLKSVEDNGQIRYAWDRPLDFGEKYFYEKCDYTKNPETADLDVADLLPKDSEIVLSLNYSDSSSRDNFEKMLEKFPEISEMGLLESMFGYNKRSENNLGNLIAPVFEEDYSVLLGLKLGAGGFEDMDTAKVFVAGKVSAADEFYSAITKSMGVEPMNEMYCELSGNELRFVSEGEDFYFVRYGDIFFVTNSDQNRDEAMVRLKAKNGYNMSSDEEKSLVSVFVDGDLLSQMMDMIYGSDSPYASLSEMYKQMGDIKTFVSVLSSNKVQIDSSVEITDTDLLNEYRGHSLSLLNKLPGKNLMAYFEDTDLGLLYQPYLDSLEMTGADLSGFSLDAVYEETGLSEAEFELLTDSPYAVGLADVGQVYPGAYIALKLDSGDLGAGEKLVSWLDKKVDEFIAESDVELSLENLSNYFKKSNMDGGLKRVTLDMKTFPESFWAENSLLEEKELIGESVFDFYYGIRRESDMNLLVVALYPDFNSNFGVSTVASNDSFKNAVASLSGVYGSNVSYFDVPSLLDYVENLMLLTGEDTSDEEFVQVKNIISTFDYFISSSELENSKMIGRSVLKLN